MFSKWLLDNQFIINAYTINDQTMLDNMLELGVTGIFTDNHKFYSNGVKLKVCKTIVSDNKLFKGAKHLNRIDNVLAKAELSKSEFDEDDFPNKYPISKSFILLEIYLLLANLVVI